MSCVDLCETVCNEVYSLGKVVGLGILATWTVCETNVPWQPYSKIIIKTKIIIPYRTMYKNTPYPVLKINHFVYEGWLKNWYRSITSISAHHWCENFQCSVFPLKFAQGSMTTISITVWVTHIAYIHLKEMSIDLKCT